MNCIKKEYEAVRKQVFSIFKIWTTYKTLFGTTEDRYNFLMKKNEDFFYIIEHCLYQQLILSIAKIFDTARDKKNRTKCSLKKFESSIKHVGRYSKSYKDFLKTLQKTTSGINDIRDEIEKYRNKIIAHPDLEIYTQRKTLNTIPRTKIIIVLDTLKEYILTIHNNFYKDISELTMELEEFDAIGAKQIIFSLIKEERYDDLRLQDIIDQDDLETNAKSYKIISKL